MKYGLSKGDRSGLTTATGGNFMSKFLCCFCNNIITGKVTALLAETNWSKESESDTNKESQQLFCHLKCLQNSLDNPKHLYIEDD